MNYIVNQPNNNPTESKEVNNMRKVLEVGRKGALIIVCDTANKFEVVSCWGYDKKSDSWAQGHYFTEWYNITEESKAKCIECARKHFEKNYK